MNKDHILERQIKELLVKVPSPTSTYEGFDTCSVLYRLASTFEWNDTEIADVDFLSKKIDISKKLFAFYLSNGRKAVDVEIRDAVYLELIAVILLKSVYISQNNSSIKIRLKRFNTLFKILDIVEPEWLMPGTDLAGELQAMWQSSLQAPDSVPDYLKISSLPNLEASNSQSYEIVPITVLFYEGPIARAYLATLNSLGLKPEKIIELVAAKDVGTKKIVGKWLPKEFRTTYAASIQRSKIHYWPKQIIKENTDVVSSLLTEVSIKFGFERAVIDNANALFPLSDYSDCVESILVESLSDKRLKQYLLKEPKGTILYTGGGIVPATLLDIKHLKFLHIHPGYLPDIRGADCALWSSLLSGHTSASCFYMAPGIDTGDIISRCWLPRLSFELDAEGIELQSKYRIVYSYLDPWVRAFVLRGVIVDNHRFDALATVPQSEMEGTTFHFMHRRLQIAAFQKLFVP